MSKKNKNFLLSSKQTLNGHYFSLLPACTRLIDWYPYVNMVRISGLAGSLVGGDYDVGSGTSIADKPFKYSFSKIQLVLHHRQVFHRLVCAMLLVLIPPKKSSSIDLAHCLRSDCQEIPPSSWRMSWAHKSRPRRSRHFILRHWPAVSLRRNDKLLYVSSSIFFIILTLHMSLFTITGEAVESPALQLPCLEEGEFIPFDTSECPSSLDTNAVVPPDLLCSKCQAICSWLQNVQLEADSEFRKLFDHYENGERLR